MRWTHAALYFISVLLLNTAQIFAQKENRPVQFKAAVNLVTVDVIITDKQGNYPTSLKREAFAVYENGIRQQIRDFDFLQLAAANSASSTKAAVPYAPSATSPSGPLVQKRIAAAERRLFILLFDNLSSQWANLSLMNAAIESFISKQLQPQDLVAILTVAGSVRLEQNFTNDHRALLAVAQRILRGSFAGSIAKFEVDNVLQEADMLADLAAKSGSADDQIMADLALSRAVTYMSMQNDFSARGTLTAIERLCECLRGVQGRKALVLVSEGFAMTRVAREGMMRAVDAANKANVSIYTINPRGLQISDATQPAVSLRQLPRQRSFQSTGRVSGGSSDFDVTQLEARANTDDDGLTDLSQSTGGLAMRNSNDYQKDLATVQHDSHSYYQLTYMPENSILDGKFRRIEVKVAGKGLTVRARRGYYATALNSAYVGTPEDQMHQALFASRRVEDLALDILPAVFLTPSGELFSRIFIHLQPKGIQLAKAGLRFSAGFRLLGGIFDERGRQISSFQRSFQLALDESSYASFVAQGASVMVNAAVPAGNYQIKAVVWEDQTGHMGVVLKDLTVPEYKAGTPYLSSIILASQIGPAPLTGGGSDSFSDTVYNPLKYGDDLVFPSLRHEYRSEDKLIFFFHAYHVADPADPQRSPYRYQVLLYRDQELYNRSALYPVERMTVHPMQGYLQATQILLEDMPAGNYMLEVVLALPDGKNRVARSVSFRLF